MKKPLIGESKKPSRSHSPEINSPRLAIPLSKSIKRSVTPHASKAHRKFRT